MQWFRTLLQGPIKEATMQPFTVNKVKLVILEHPDKNLRTDQYCKCIVIFGNL